MSNTITHQFRWEIILWIGWKNIPCYAKLTCCSLMDRKPKQLFLSFCHHRHHHHHHHKRPASCSLILFQWICILEIYKKSTANISVCRAKKSYSKLWLWSCSWSMITLVSGRQGPRLTWKVSWSGNLTRSLGILPWIMIIYSDHPYNHLIILMIFWSSSW